MGKRKKESIREREKERKRERVYECAKVERVY